MMVALLRKVIDPATGKMTSKIIHVEWSKLKPEGTTIEEQLEWFESTYIWMPAKIHPDGSIHNMRVGQVFRKGPRKGEIGIHKKQQKPVPRHLRMQGVQDDGTALGTFEIGWDYKVVPDRPDDKGRIYLDSSGSEKSSSSGKKGSLGQRVLSYSAWVPIWVVYDKRYYQALKKKLRPKVLLYRQPKPAPELQCDICGQVFRSDDGNQTLAMHRQHWINRHENSHSNLMAVAQTLEKNAAFLAKEKQNSLTNTKITSSLSEMIASAENIRDKIFDEEGRSVVKKAVKGDVTQGHVQPARSLAN